MKWEIQEPEGSWQGFGDNVPIAFSHKEELLVELEKVSLKKRLVTLFFSMLSISTFTFGGGFVIVTLMKRRFVDDLKWLKEDDMLDMTAIAQSCPGAIAVNGAILVGRRVAGAAGIAVAYFNVTTFDDYERLMRTFTDITGRADLYDQNVAKVAEAIDAVTAQVPAENPPTALVLTTFSGGTRVQSFGTQTGAMLADLGVNNLADENRSLLKDFSLEAVIEMDPDFIFVIPMGNDTEAAMRNLEEATAANPAWSSLSAVQNGRYITLDPTLYLAKPNAQWDAAYQGLFDNLYGQN